MAHPISNSYRDMATLAHFELIDIDLKIKKLKADRSFVESQMIYFDRMATLTEEAAEIGMLPSVTKQ